MRENASIELDNIDSEYKKSMLDLMTEQHKTSRIERYQTKQLNLFQANEHVECYFDEEKKEEGKSAELVQIGQAD